MGKLANNVVSMKEIEHDKADPIQFIGGTYSGRGGWFRKSKKERGTEYFYVIVDLGDGFAKKTWTRKTSVSRPLVPNDFSEAIILEYSDVEAKLVDLCSLLARFKLKTADQEQLSQIFYFKLGEAMHAYESSKAKKKPYATEFPKDGKKKVVAKKEK